jgi:ribosome-associated protein
MAEGTVRIDEVLSIPEAELSFRASRSGGPGGQHVNTSSTRVELIWDVRDSPSLDDAQRARLMEKLSNRISGEGLLTLAASGSRSQHQNRADAIDRFARLVRDALREPRPRRKTRPPRASREARLREKKRRSETKRLRKSLPPD